MDQKLDRISPLFINTDKSYKNLLPEEAAFITGMSIDINANPGDSIGTSNPTGEGQNDLVLTPSRSNEALPNVLKPEGNNKNNGSFESVTTQELYYANFNSNGNHGLYMVDGNTGLWYTLIVNPALAFSDEQEHFVADHRWRLRITKDSDGNVLEKYLIFTDGKNWQKYINVRAAIATDGFNAALFPYWTLQPPHFDRRELFEYAIRPPMYAPIAVPIPNTAADSGVQNRVIDQSFQFAIAFQNTDGRVSTLSPYSLPYNTISESFLNDPENIPKKGKLTLYAGSPMTEKILIYVRTCGDNWAIYDTIEKFSSCGVNDPSVIGNQFWLRTGQWADYNYDSNMNTIEFIFDNSKVSEIIDSKNANRLQNDMPQVSVGMTDLEDAIGLVNNRYGYPNFGCEITDKFDVIVKEKEDTGCSVQLRKLKLYVYVGRERGNRSQNTPNQSPERDIWISQVGYYIGDDTQMRFGGIGYENDSFFIDTDESKYFQLDFADRDGFICYLKGTPYTSTCKWYQVKADLSLTPLDGLLNSQNTSDTSFMQNVYQGRGFFVGVFEFTVPAGRYNATIGRHNVASTSDYRNKSTYILGIANSRVVSTSSYGNAPYPIASLKPNSIISNSKEMEIDCTNGDVDVWGRGAAGDIFYIACPFQGAYDGRNRWSWIEGYLYEQRDSLIPVELFPNRLSPNQIGTGGQFTDKNGFFWGYTWGLDNSHMDANTLFTVKLNCVYPSNFTVPNNFPGNSGWKQNGNVYLSDFNGGEVGDCNRIIYSGKITSLDGLTNYSNIAISIVDGQTAYTRSDGTFDLIVHNGQNNTRVSNVYVNTGGNFLITIAGCGQVPVFQFVETACVLNYNGDCMVRRFFPNLLLNVNIESSRVNSLKENGRYSVGIAGTDLAGRIMAVNIIEELNVSSFLQRNNLRATYFQLLIQSFNLAQQYPDIKWFIPYVSKNVAVLKYVDWVGDSIHYLDSNGNIVNDPASAVFVSIRINSLYNFNIANNFSPLSKYQFVEGDRLRVFDDGEGHLFDVATYGDPIDVQIFGTNYNQAAINAGLQVPQENTILNPTAEQQNENLSISLIVKYDSRLTKLIGKTGFWIEIYTPTKVSDNIPYCETQGAYPVINGQLARFTGFANGQPTYNFPTELNLDFWDTYFLQRTIAIPDVGSKYFNHPFQSPNITDYWGGGCTSCGRQNAKDDNAMQRWYGGDIIRSDAFVEAGVINGLGTFRSENRKDYGTYPYGAIISAHTKRNIIAFICENDWFTVGFKMPYSELNDQGYLVTSPGDFSQPRQKTGDIFGCSPTDTSTVIIDDRNFFWLDSKNTGWIKCDYQTATDISQQDEQRGERGGVQSYLNAKIEFIEKWNYAHELKDRFDKVSGIDSERGNVYLTFRPRRNNTNDINSYITGRRNISLGYQETIVYNIQYRSWIPFANFSGESYARLRGKWANVEFISFAQGKPYIHNNTPNNSFLKFYGVQTQPSVIGVIAGDKVDKELAKTFANLSYESNPNVWAVDMAYTDLINSFTYVPANFFKRKGGIYFGPLLQNANSYPPVDPDQVFRSMLVDGYGIRNMYLVFRLVGQFEKLNKYNELKSVYCLYSLQPMNQK
jgi:hypothetical protein